MNSNRNKENTLNLILSTNKEGEPVEVRLVEETDEEVYSSYNMVVFASGITTVNSGKFFFHTLLVVIC